MTRWLAAPPIINPNLGSGFSGGGVAADDANMMKAAEAKSVTDNRTAANTAQREDNAAVTQEAGNIRAARPMIPNLGTTTVQSPYVAGSTIGTNRTVVPGKPGANGFINPNVGNPVAAGWFGQGGSAATMHAAQAARGIRPAIDARATPSPADAGPSTSDAIMAGWGWHGAQTGTDSAGNPVYEPHADFGGVGDQISGQMSSDFNNSAAAQQATADRAARLAAAKAQLAREFGPAMPGGGQPITGSPAFSGGDATSDNQYA
jgi:hypothetical protein